MCQKVKGDIVAKVNCFLENYRTKQQDCQSTVRILSWGLERVSGRVPALHVVDSGSVFRLQPLSLPRNEPWGTAESVSKVFLEKKFFKKNFCFGAGISVFPYRKILQF